MISMLKGRFQTIAAKFNLLIIMLIVVTSGGISFFLARSEISHSYHDLLDHGLNIASMASHNSEYSIYTEDKETMSQLLRNLISDKNIDYACLLNDQRIELICMHSENNTPIPTAFRQQVNLRTKISYNEFTNQEDGHRFIDILSPVIGSTGDGFAFTQSNEPKNKVEKVIGYVQLGVNQAGLRERKQQVLLSTVSFTFLFIFLGVALTLLMTRRITSPIKQLNSATQSISEGNLDQHIDIHSHDEVSELAHSFNHMLGRLKEYRTQVEERNQELKRANDQMLREVEVRREAERSLARKTEELTRSNSELEQFAYIVSHDLQEPLRKITAFGDRLLGKFADFLGDDGKDYLGRMQNASRRMQTLIQDLLKYSRIKTKANPFTTVDLNIVAKEVLSDLEVRIEQTGGRVDVDDLPTIEADPLQMRQMFQNIIGNALKFHQKDVAPVVRIRAESGSNGNGRLDGNIACIDLCTISIEDNGIGFDEKYADRIFQVFQRLHGRSEYEGTGIGLSVCRKITERHGGTLEAKSTPGSGAKFIIALPYHQKKGGENGNEEANHDSDG